MHFCVMAVFETKTEAMEVCAHPSSVLELWPDKTPYVPWMKQIAKLFIKAQLVFFSHVRVLNPTIPVAVLTAVELTTCWTSATAVTSVTSVTRL